MATNQRLENRFFAAERQVCVLADGVPIFIPEFSPQKQKVGMDSRCPTPSAKVFTKLLITTPTSHA
jgi:hypothetical protein